MMRRHSLLLFSLFLSLCASCALAHTSLEWRKRNIYQVLTDRFAPSDYDKADGCDNWYDYCGGTWKGIENHLDYIQDLGFNAIWISPIPTQKEGSYHGYHFTDLWGINSHFGTREDLKSLIKAAHAKDIWVMLDVVANHVGNTNEDFSQIQPFNESRYYHSRCQIKDWNNQWEVENCRLADLPDLAQENAFVRDELLRWIHKTVEEFEFDGLRIDTTPEVPRWFWKEFNVHAGVYTMGEVLNGRLEYVAKYQGCLDATLNYPVFFALRNVYGRQSSMTQLGSTLSAVHAHFPSPSILGTFTDNHDQNRFLHDQSDWTLYKNALTFQLMSQGISILYYGSEQGYGGGHDPACREPMWLSGGFNREHELYKYIRTIMQFKMKLGNLAQHPYQTERYVDDQFYAFTRGDALVATTNVGSEGPEIRRTITYHPYRAGEVLCNVFYPHGDCIQVKPDRSLDVYLERGEAKIFYPKNKWPSDE